MKKILLLALAIFPLVAHAEMALVYKSEADVKAGKIIPGLVAPDGIVISATDLMSANMAPLAGLTGQELKKASVVRFDNDVNLALIRLGDRIGSDDLQKAHLKNSAGVMKFLPAGGQSTEPTLPVLVSTEVFGLRIDGVDVGTEPVVLKKKRKQSALTFEVVYLSTKPAWRFEFAVESEPKLGFWKKGQQGGINDVPQYHYRYSHQLLFSPLGSGESFKIPVEVFYIKEENYQFNVKMESKAGVTEKTVNVRFENNK